MLELFPERTLDNSIHTAIWLGLLVSWSFTERLGWVFAGFVVPGYLAALAVVHPLSLVATCTEAVLTWAGVWALGVLAGRLGLWNVVFGRERFLLFVLLSIPARLLVEGLAAPTLQAWLQPMSEAPAWAGGQFYSVGLVLVPLLANAFWKTGLAAGVVQVGSSTTLTWLLLTVVVMPLTNYELTRFELSFEAIALDFLYAPKTYLVLLLTALVAAGNNVRYGWDFNGILVPSLLALVISTPSKFVMTFVEIVVLVVLFKALLRVPAVARRNLEGPRRLVAMFTLSYLLKALLGFIIEPLWPDRVLSDLLGFGYLLTSLAAVKCIQTGRTVGTLLTIGWTALQGWGLATIIAVALVVVRPPLPRPDERALEAGGSVDRAVLLAAGRVAELVPEEDPASRERVLLRATRALADGGGASAPAVRRWMGTGGTVQPLLGGCTGVWERRVGLEPPAPLPTVIACSEAGPWAVVPRPRAEPEALVAAAWLLSEGVVAGVAVVGLDPEGPPAAAPTLRVREALGDHEVWWIRGRAGGGSRFSPHHSGRGDLPAPLRALLPELALAFDPAPPWGRGHDATLAIDRTTLDRVLPEAQVRTPPRPDAVTMAAWEPLVRAAVQEGEAPRWRWAATTLGGAVVEGGLGTPVGPISVRPEGAPVVLVVERSPGLDAVGAYLWEALDAKALVVTDRPVDGEPRPADLLLLALLRGAGADARLIWLRPGSATLDPGPALGWTDGRVHPDGLALTADLARALEPWGTPAVDDGSGGWTPFDGDLWLVELWGAVSDGRAAVLRVDPARLVEADGHPDKAALLSWAAARGVTVRSAGSMPPLALRSEPLPPLGEALQALAADPSDGSVEAVRATLSVEDAGSHLVWWAERAGLRCRATAAAAACGSTP